MNKYICKVDGSEFLSESELIEYIKNTYVNVVSTEIDSEGLSCESIYKELKADLPDNVDINVKTDTDDGGFKVSINSTCCDFSFQVGEGAYNYYYSRFPDTKSALKHYQEYFNSSYEIIRKVKDKYDIQLKVKQMFESPEGDHSISFDFQLNEQDQCEVYEFEGIDLFIKNFEQYVSNILEGKLEIIRKESHTEFTIDGISIEGFAVRGKRVRLEILE